MHHYIFASFLIFLQEFSPWVQQVVRLWAGARHVEIDWTVGPIPIADGLGKAHLLP